MYTRLALAACCALLFVAAETHAGWMLLDDFQGQGPIGGADWLQTTPQQNFYMEGGRLLANGKAQAVHQTFPQQHIRFEAFSGAAGVGARDVSVQTVSAILGMRTLSDYYELRLLSDNLLTTDFYRLHFYSVVGGTANNDLTINFASPFDALRVDASLAEAQVKLTVQPFDRATGADIGASLNYSFSPVPGSLINSAGPSYVGLGAQGKFVEIDNFEGFVVPESTTLLLAALACVPCLRARRRH